MKAVATRTSPHTGNRLAALDGLRLLAAVAVVAKHWIGVGGAGLTADLKFVYPWGTKDMAALFGPLQVAASYGWLGVNLFFLISGFVICMSGWGRSLSAFFTSRVARLFPAYWFAIAITVAVMLASDLTGGQLRRGATNVLLNLTMVQHGYGGVDVDPSYWTLWWELRFYLLFAIVVALGTTYRRVVAFCVLWTVGAIAAAASGDKLADFAAMHAYAPYFISGVALYLIYRYGQNFLLWGIVGFNYLLALTFVVPQAAGQMKGSGVVPSTIVLDGIVTLSFGVLILVALRKVDRVQWRWLTIAGALTYPLYLMHQVLGFVGIAILHKYLPPGVVVLVVFLGMLTLSWLVWRFVERPMSRWLRTRLNLSFAKIREDGEPAELDAPAKLDAPAGPSAGQPIPAQVTPRPAGEPELAGKIR